MGARVVLLVAAVLWSASIGITGLEAGFLTLYVARTVLGVAEGPNFPALTGAVSHLLAPHERAIALGNTLVAGPLALAIGAPVVTQLIHAFGWRGILRADGADRDLDSPVADLLPQRSGAVAFHSSG